MTLKKVIFLSLIGLLIVAVVIGSLFFFVFNKNPKDQSAVKEYYIYEIGELYTNIKDSNSILKLNLSVEYNNKDLLQTFVTNNAKITNNILELLRNKTLDDLSGKTGQEAARNDILDLIKQIINSEDISNIYFTEFITQ